jgi:hypothetical protein
MTQCACGAEWATITVTTELGSVRVGRRCIGILVEMLARLSGLEPKRRPALKAVK